MWLQEATSGFPGITYTPRVYQGLSKDITAVDHGRRFGLIPACTRVREKSSVERMALFLLVFSCRSQNGIHLENPPPISPVRVAFRFGGPRQTLSGLLFPGRPGLPGFPARIKSEGPAQASLSGIGVLLGNMRFSWLIDLTFGLSTQELSCNKRFDFSSKVAFQTLCIRERSPMVP